MAVENLKCPTCGGPMVSRLNRVKNQRFWGCQTYPECKGTRDTDGEAPRRRGEDASDEESETGAPSERQRRNDSRRWD